MKRLAGDEGLREALRRNASRFYHQRLRPLMHVKRLEAVFKMLSYP